MTKYKIEETEGGKFAKELKKIVKDRSQELEKYISNYENNKETLRFMSFERRQYLQAVELLKIGTSILKEGL